MKKLRPDSVLIAVFVVGCLLLFGWFNVTKPRILILHSYDPGYAWTRDVNRGLLRALEDGYRYQLRWYYMDTKRHPTDSHRQSAGKAAANVIREMKPDVVIAVDDDAQQYVARHLIKHPSTQVVFAGVNTTAERYGYDLAPNVTGILERLPVAAIREALRVAQWPQRKDGALRIVHLGDASDSVAGDVLQLSAFDWAPLSLRAAPPAANWPAWQASVKALAGQADVLLLTGYRKLPRSASDKTLVPPEEVVAWTEANSPVPVISGNGFFVEDGGMLGIGNSPYEQGEEAARRALAMALQGQRAINLPVTSSQHFIVTMNGTLMRKRGFKLPPVYEAAARMGDQYKE